MKHMARGGASSCLPYVLEVSAWIDGQHRFREKLWVQPAGAGRVRNRGRRPVDRLEFHIPELKEQMHEGMIPSTER